MTTLLLDASVLLSAFDSDDQQHQSARSLLADDTVTLATLDLARYEVANVAIRAWREPGVVPSLLEAIERIAEDGGMVTSSRVLLAQAAEVAEQHGLSVYDATYAAAAATANRCLISCDNRDLVSTGLATLPAAFK